MNTPDEKSQKSNQIIDYTVDCRENLPKTQDNLLSEVGVSQKTSTPEVTGALKTLFDSYEEMRNTSWAELIEEEQRLKCASEQKDEVIMPAKLDSPGFLNTCLLTTSHDKRAEKVVKTANYGIEKSENIASKRKRIMRAKNRTAHCVYASEVVSDHPSRTGEESCRKLPRRLSNRNQAVNFASSTDDEGNLEPARHQVKRKRTEINDSSFNFNYSNSKCRMNSSIKKSDMESSSTDGTSILSTLRVKKHWVEPKLGWCRDEVTLQRRTKEIAKAKEKPIYIKYFSMIARSSRTKNMPKTPNKYINYSRRSWDQQVRIWKRSLYVWGNETPTESCVSSCESTSTDISNYDADSSFSSSLSLASDENEPFIDSSKIEPDAAASLLGHLDIDTRSNTLTLTSVKTDEESTLKGTPKNVLGPRDFSHL